MPLHIIRNPTDDMKVMQEEIFGPVLPVKTYKNIDEAIDYVNENDRPLGLYYFGQDKREEDRVLTRTSSGGVTVNDVLFHHAMEDLALDRKRVVEGRSVYAREDTGGRRSIK